MRFFLAESLELSLQITTYMANKKLPNNANLKIISTLNENVTSCKWYRLLSVWFAIHFPLIYPTNRVARSSNKATECSSVRSRDNCSASESKRLRWQNSNMKPQYDKRNPNIFNLPPSFCQCICQRKHVTQRTNRTVSLQYTRRAYNSNILIANIGSYILSQNISKLTVWKRYLDDLFACV